MILGGVEAGGTKFVCLVGDGEGRILAEQRIPTRGPRETLAEAVDALRRATVETGALDAIGVAAFGPLDLRPGSGHGRLLSTPKPGWSGVDLVSPLRDAFGVPVAIDTDVTAAALAEGRWGAALGLESFAYMTVGTGIGVGVIAGGRPLHGLVHPEFGHVNVPRAPGDDFPGVCPFHADCLEGMASGPAISARWGVPAEDLDGALRERVVELEAIYLASGSARSSTQWPPSGSCSAAGWPAWPGCCRACARTWEWHSAGIRASPSTPTRPSCRRRASGRWPGPGGRS